MMIALSEYLVTLPPGDSIAEQQLVEVFAEHWRREPWRGYGAGPPHIFGLVLAGTKWADAAVALFPPQGSFGNGGAMRVAPVACMEVDLDRMAAQARASARTTHMHPLGQDGAVIQAAAVWSVLHSRPDEPMAVDSFIDRIAELIEAAEYREKLEIVRKLAVRGTPERAADELGNGTAAVASVPTALLAFLRHPDNFVAAVKFAIQVGGDTDTIAAMTGAIAGTRHGLGAVPPNWLSRLENEPDLRRLADRLADRLCGRGKDSDSHRLSSSRKHAHARKVGG
jgi:poly(ADP-ribose) glycohydrolase ARH3